MVRPESARSNVNFSVSFHNFNREPTPEVSVVHLNQQYDDKNVIWVSRIVDSVYSATRKKDSCGIPSRSPSPDRRHENYKPTFSRPSSCINRKTAFRNTPTPWTNTDGASTIGEVPSGRPKLSKEESRWLERLKGIESVVKNYIQRPSTAMSRSTNEKTKQFPTLKAVPIVCLGAHDYLDDYLGQKRPQSGSVGRVRPDPPSTPIRPRDNQFEIDSCLRTAAANSKSRPESKTKKLFGHGQSSEKQSYGATFDLLNPVLCSFQSLKEPERPKMLFQPSLVGTRPPGVVEVVSNGWFQVLGTDKSCISIKLL